MTVPDVRGVGECRACWLIRLLRCKNLCWNCWHRLTPLGAFLRTRFPPVGPKGNRYPDRKRAAKGKAGPAIPVGATREERVAILTDRVAAGLPTARHDDRKVRSRAARR